MQEARGSYDLMLIEAAIEQGIRPTSLVLRVQPRAKWNQFDFVCSEAYKIVVNERCAQCGLPRWMCHNDDSDIGFKVIEDLCYATKEVETVDAKKSSKQNYKAPKGVRTRPEPYRYSGRPLDGAVREEYYKAEAEKANPES